MATFRQWVWFLAVLGILTAAGECLVWRFVAPSENRILWAIAAPLPGISVLIGAAVTNWIGRSAAAKGPILRYSIKDGILHLPRRNRTVPRNQIVRFDLISGVWIRDLYSRGEHLFENGTELHAVIRLKAGRVVSLPLLGTQGKVWKLNRGLGLVARVLSEVNGIPLERIEEPTGFRDPYTQIRKRIERGQCPACSYQLTGNTSGVCPECGRSVLVSSPPYPSQFATRDKGVSR